MQTLLSFDRAPPFAAPARFFLTAPLFAFAAATLLAVEGPVLLASRWTPGLLAATHLVTVGFMLMVMFGALIQILPVVAGANLADPLATARWLHPALSLGALLLAAGFLGGQVILLLTATAVLVLAVLGFLWAAGRPLMGMPSTSPTIRGLKLALLGLAGAIGAGSLVAIGLALGWPYSMALMTLADLHAGWALGGWSGVLLAAMAYVVVPMFQLTPGYPARMGWLFPPLIVALLLAWTLAALTDSPLLERAARGGMAIAGIGFAIHTLRLQGRRRRARIDATLRYWQLALASTIAALAMQLLAALLPGVANGPSWPVLAGTLLVVGGFVSFIAGMLYKIVPFLGWLHLQNGGGAIASSSRILADRQMLYQSRAHFIAVGLLLGAVVWPEWLARPAGLALMAASAWLFGNLLGAVLRYRRYAAEAGSGDGA
jgi:hypothetical protein